MAKSAPRFGVVAGATCPVACQCPHRPEHSKEKTNLLPGTPQSEAHNALKVGMIAEEVTPAEGETHLLVGAALGLAYQFLVLLKRDSVTWVALSAGSPAESNSPPSSDSSGRQSELPRYRSSTSALHQNCSRSILAPALTPLHARRHMDEAQGYHNTQRVAIRNREPKRTACESTHRRRTALSKRAEPKPGYSRTIG